MHITPYLSVTEIAPKSPVPVFCVNRSPIRYGFHAGPKTNRYIINKVDIAFQYPGQDSSGLAFAVQNYISKASQKIVIILHFFKFHRWKIIFMACFAAYPNLENKSQKCAKSRDLSKNQESLGCTRSISCSLVGKSSEVSAMFVNLARNALFLFFCGFKVLLP